MGNKQDLTDVALIEQFQHSRDASLIVTLLKRYSEPISMMCFRYFHNEDDTKDFTSELYLKMHEKLPEVDLAEIQNFKGWFRILIRNMIHDRLRKDKTYNGYRELWKAQRETIDFTERKQVVKMDNEIVQQALAELPHPERLCVELIYIQELSYVEIMEQHQLTLNQVRGARERGIKKLRQSLKADFEKYFYDF